MCVFVVCLDVFCNREPWVEHKKQPYQLYKHLFEITTLFCLLDHFCNDGLIFFPDAKIGSIRMATTNALIAHRQGLEEIEV